MRRKEIDSQMFGSNLRFYRNLRGYTVEEVREYLCLGSAQSVYKWESGKNFPQADTLIALMELYEIDYRELLEEPQERNIDYLLWQQQETEQRGGLLIDGDWSRGQGIDLAAFKRDRLCVYRRLLA
ncbi:MAG: helix-turn-helix transcriptional regulator [Lachnospiraceae bacterium]|nr:helix-turn-helix transcriptional regulator [Lachnospiraceae bacterium]